MALHARKRLGFRVGDVLAALLADLVHVGHNPADEELEDGHLLEEREEGADEVTVDDEGDPEVVFSWEGVSEVVEDRRIKRDLPFSTASKS